MIKPTRPLHPRDGHRRRISYLRLAVTDRCNLRCRYCLPASGLPPTPAAELLSSDELVTVAQAAVSLGISKIRITGGEPLLRPDLVPLLTRLRGLPGLERLVLTTNGVQLTALAEPLRRAGVDGVNVSIDSLEPERFAEITRGGRLADCLAGLAAALAKGFTTKLNVVVMAGINDDEIERFAALALELPVAVRFIEHMPGGAAQADPGLTVPSARVLERLAAMAPLIPVIDRDPGRLSGPARMYRVAGAPGSVGVIPGVSCDFCHECNRIRIAATGEARGCLFQDRPVDLRRHLREGRGDDLVAALSALIAAKPLGRASPGADPVPQPLVAMSRIGG